MTTYPEFTTVPEFYAGRSIFVTGATGFMGKVLVEKLLRSCPAVKTVYLLVRPKKGQEPPDRIKTLLQSKLFKILRQQMPNFDEKIVGICGDILEPGLGLSQSDLSILKSEVSVVFHSAATVKFDEALKLSIQMNVLGVTKLLDLCHQMTKLEAFIHVSTAYCNSDKEYIAESVYEPPLHPQKILDAVEWMDDCVVDTLTPKLIPPRPNTYTYTKAMAEYLLVEKRGTLPCCIIRPSIIGASWREPFPGWVDNFNGPTGLLVAIGKGLLRTMHGNTKATSDLIPVDIVANLMLAAAWSTAIERPENVMVYNCTTGQVNNLTWGQLEMHSFADFMKNPMDIIARVPNPKFTSSRIWRDLNIYFDHLLPAWIMDLYMRATGNKPIFMRIQNRIWKSVHSLEYFTCRGWTFNNENVFELYERLCTEDKKTFNFDARTIHWPTYVENYCLGTKQYAMGEDLRNLPKARGALLRTQRIHRVLKVILFVVGSRLLFTRFQAVRNLWYFFVSVILRLTSKIPLFARS